MARGVKGRWRRGERRIRFVENELVAFCPLEMDDEVLDDAKENGQSVKLMSKRVWKLTRMNSQMTDLGSAREVDALCCHPAQLARAEVTTSDFRESEREVKVVSAHLGQLPLGDHLASSWQREGSRCWSARCPLKTLDQIVGDSQMEKQRMIPSRVTETILSPSPISWTPMLTLVCCPNLVTLAPVLQSVTTMAAQKRIS